MPSHFSYGDLLCFLQEATRTGPLWRSSSADSSVYSYVLVFTLQTLANHGYEERDRAPYSCPADRLRTCFLAYGIPKLGILALPWCSAARLRPGSSGDNVAALRLLKGDE